MFRSSLSRLNDEDVVKGHQVIVEVRWPMINDSSVE